LAFLNCVGSAPFLEFKLHNGHKYATVIIDLETGHVLWLACSKRKEVVYDFCDHVGEEWMSHVEAIACDMNADFERAFLERFPHLDVVYDRFHLIKNFNEKVISEVRKDEQARLSKEGHAEAARSLKHSKYILMSGEDTRERKDQDARAGKVVSKGSRLFGKEEAVQKGGARERYRELISHQAPHQQREGGRHQPDDQDAQEGRLRIAERTQGSHPLGNQNCLRKTLAHPVWAQESSRRQRAGGSIKMLASLF
jgi:hypothetical protein